MPGIWGDRVAGLAHHLLAHIGDHYTPIQLLKTPNTGRKKYQFPASQLGNLLNTSRTEQERTHTHVLSERRESTELVPRSPPLPHLSCDWPVGLEPSTPLVKMLVVPPTWQNEFDHRGFLLTYPAYLLQFCKMQSK